MRLPPNGVKGPLTPIDEGNGPFTPDRRGHSSVGGFPVGTISQQHRRPNGVAARLRAGGCQYREFMAGTMNVIVWYNPRCSKCRGAEQVLAEYGVPAQKVFYLDDPPSRAEITRVLALLGAADPRR
jgi:hypothetical protein